MAAASGLILAKALSDLANANQKGPQGVIGPAGVAGPRGMHI